MRETQVAINELYDDYLADNSEELETPAECSHSGTATDSGTSIDLDNVSPSKTGNNLTDNEVIAKAKRAQTGEQFRRVWRGDYSHQPNHSEARLELYNYLAFWTGKDERQMWRLFRESGLYPHPEEPGKCNRLKDREIQAIRDTRNVYTGTVNTDKLPDDSKQVAPDGSRLTVSNELVVAVIEALEELGKASTDTIVDPIPIERT